MRIKKAWRIYPPNGFFSESDVFYAHTAAKARAEMVRQLDWDDGWAHVLKCKVERAKDLDIHFSTRLPLADDLTKKELHIISHSYGTGYRDHYCAGGEDIAICKRLMDDHGLFYSPFFSLMDDDERLFRLTDKGKDLAKSVLPLYGEYG